MTRALFAPRILAVVAMAALLVASFPRHAIAARSDMSGEATIQVQRAGSETAEVLRLRIEVSYKGWNGQPDFTIEAVEGQQVELTFVWADTAVPDNAHRIRIEGYDLRSQLIDIDNREATISFIADRTGTFELVCDWRCEGHKEALEQARLKVVQAGATGGSNPAGSASYLPTAMSLAIEAAATTGAVVRLSASLQDEAGTPVAGAKVRFLVDRSFAGADGEMEIGVAETDAEGVAALAYTPSFTGTHTVRARFAGVGLYAPAEEASVIEVTQVEPTYRVAPKGLDGIRTWTPPMVFIIVAAIWLTFALVLTQVYYIRTDDGRD